MKYLFFLLNILLVNYNSIAQEYYVPNTTSSCPNCREATNDVPTASSSDYAGINFINGLGRYGNVPVDFYTGTVSHNISLYTIQCKDYAIPISLNYASTGIKAAQEAEWTGLGWNLIAAPPVTRIIRGGDDFTSGPSGTGNILHYKSGIKPNCTSISDGQNVSSIVDKETDLERDIFYFTVGNYSGKFILDKSQNPYQIILLQKENIKVQLVYTTNISVPSIYITTEDGTQYFYGEIPGGNLSSSYIQAPANFSEVSTLTTDKNISNYPYGGDIIETTTNQFISAWYLRKIITPLGDEINFDYSNKSKTTVLKNRPKYLQIYRTIASLQNDRMNVMGTLTQTMITAGGRLKQISFPNGIIKFITDSNRNDLWLSNDGTPADYRLNSIQIFNNDVLPKLIKRWDFNYGYFNDATLLAGQPVDANATTLRLKLSSLSEVNVISNIANPPYLFTYLESIPAMGDIGKLPPKDAGWVDHWGYYNYHGDDTWAPSETVTINGTKYPLSGSNRNANPDLVQLGILTKVTYPTKGFIEYTYEPHDYYSLYNTQVIIGGVRIQKTRVNDGFSNNDIIKTYSYQYEDVYTIHGRSSGVLQLDVMYTRLADRPILPIVRSSRNIMPLGTNTNGNIVGYSKVTVYNGANGELGKTVYEYHNLPNYTISGSYYRIVYSNIENLTPAWSLDWTLPNPNTWQTLMFVRNGLLKANTNYKKIGDDYFPISTVKNTYNNVSSTDCFSGPVTSYTEIMKNGSTYKTGYVGAYTTWCDYIEIIPYYTPSLMLKLTSTTETIFNRDQISGTTNWNTYADLTKVTKFEYSNIHYQVTKIYTNPDAVDGFYTQYIYPLDYGLALPDPLPVPLPANSIYQMLIPSTRNISNVPIEKIYFKKINGTYQVIGGEFNTFKYLDSNHPQTSPVVPEYKYSLEINQPLIESQQPSDVSTPGYFVSSKNIGQGSILKDDDYQLQISYNNYDSYGNNIDKTIAGNYANSLIWGYSNSLPVAITTNASQSQTSFTSFEDTPANYGWEIGSGTYTKSTSLDNNVHSGDRSYYFGGGSLVYGVTKNLTPIPNKGVYKLSCWVKTDASFGTSSPGSIVMYTTQGNGNNTNYPLISGSFVATNFYDTYGQWKYFEVVLDLDYVKAISNMTSQTLGLRCFAQNVNFKGFYIDDIRIQPVDAAMTTYTYTPLLGKTSEMDANNIITHTEYDGFGRPFYIKDQDKNIIKKFTYTYKP